MSTALESPPTAISRQSAAREVPHATATPRGSAGRLLFVCLACLGVGATAYFLLGLLTPSTQASQEFILHEIRPQALDIIVTERGGLESGKNIDLLCEVEARNPQSAATTILQIVKEGTRVAAGELVVELDSASLKDQITQQQIKVEQSKAQLTKANTDLEITRSQNDSDIQTAQIAVDLTGIDLRRYVEGDYLQEKRNIQGEMVIAEEELNRAKERLEYSEKLSKKGYISSSEVESDRLAVIKAQNSLNVAKEKMRVLEEYTKPRQTKDLESKLDEAKRKLDRVKSESKAKESQSESAMLAQKLTTETEESTLRKLEKQLDKCKIFAPVDGMVVYANDPNSMMRGQPQLQIEEGASVRERQKIIRIPDLKSMLVNVKVHEAKVNHVRPGQVATIRVESMPDKIFSGTVKTVATTADAQSFFSASGVQVYTVMVAIDDEVEGMKPGMTAAVEIVCGRLNDVLTVPVQAVVEREGQNYCYVLPPGQKSPELRRVVIGSNNDKMVAIEQDTVKAGERVIENVSAVIKEDALTAVAKADAEKYKAEKPAPPAKASPVAGGELAKNSAGGPGGDAEAKARSRGRQGGGAGGPGGAGGAGGFQMPTSGADWIKMSDKNGDGKVAKDELPEFAQNYFSTMDTNGDGFVDGAEADALIERMKSMPRPGGGGAPGAPGGGAPGGPPAGQP